MAVYYFLAQNGKALTFGLTAVAGVCTYGVLKSKAAINNDYSETILTKSAQQYYNDDFKPNMCKEVLGFKNGDYSKCVLNDEIIENAINRHKKNGDHMVAAYAIAKRQEFYDICDRNPYGVY